MQATGETDGATPVKRVGWRRALPALLWSALLIVIPLFYLWVNLAGQHRLEAVRQSLAQQGESLQMRDYSPGPIPAEENFCAIPSLDGLAVGDGDSPAGQAAKAKRDRITAMLPPRGKKVMIHILAGGYPAGVPMDFTAHVAALRKDGYFKTPAGGAPEEEILSAYAPMQPVIDEMAAALDRPGAQWTPTPLAQPGYSYGSAQQYPMTVALDLAKHLPMRGCIAAQAGDGATALATWRMIERLRRATAELPTLIDLLVAIAIHQLEHKIVWECQYAKAGTLAEWRLWEQEQAAIDYRKTALNSWSGERAFGQEMTANMKRNRHSGELLYMLAEPASLLDGTQKVEVLNHVEPYFPGGFYDLNAATLAQLETKYFVEPIKRDDWKEILTQIAQDSAELAELRDHPFSHLDAVGALAVPSLLQGLYKLVYAVAQSNQATIACRLEVFRLEHGEYPASLAGLTLSDGRPLPTDPIDGAPMRYRRTDDGRFALWSLGFDGKDDGGRRGPTLPPSPSDPTYKGDWVWSFSGEPKKTAARP